MASEYIFIASSIVFLGFVIYITFYLQKVENEERGKIEESYKDSLKESALDPSNRTKRDKVFILGHAYYRYYYNDINYPIDIYSNDFLAGSNIPYKLRDDLIQEDINRARENLKTEEFEGERKRAA